MIDGYRQAASEVRSDLRGGVKATPASGVTTLFKSGSVRLVGRC